MSGNPITNVSSQTPVISTSQYAANDAIGGRMSFTVPSLAVANGGGTLGASLVVVDLASRSNPFVIYFFDQAFTATADNDPFAPSAADLRHCIGTISIAAADYVPAGANGSVATKFGVTLAFTTSGGGIVYAQAKIASGTPTYLSTSDLIFRLGGLSD